ncbi:MAG: AMP-binding protein [Acidobacteriaceae bacterium]
MKKQQSSHNDWTTLWDALRTSGDYSDQVIAGAEGTVFLRDLVAGSMLYNRGDELAGRCVLVATTSQLTTASALIELDGLARRIVVCPPDLPMEHLPYVIETAEVEAIVSDRSIYHFGSQRNLIFSPCSRALVPRTGERAAADKSEWILLTSGTTGRPKLVAHTLESLAGAIRPLKSHPGTVVWSTFYDIRRYGGLQILLRAVLTRTSLVLSNAQEPISAFFERAANLGVTHISGTPSHWRRALMSSSLHLISPEYVRLSGEIADQSILNSLRSAYPLARIIHAFASTEAGVAFEVTDGLAGFPVETLHNTPNVEMKRQDGSLKIRSARNARCYLGGEVHALKGADGFVDTGDMLEVRGNRYHFVGRRDGVINIGGLKVHPEEVESVINRHPAVRMSLVRTKKSSITGALVIADVVLQGEQAGSEIGSRALQDDILLLCRKALSSHKVPAAINFIPELSVAESGKLLRRNA